MIPILSEHSHFLLANKPAGLFTQAAPGVPSLHVELTEQLKVRDEHSGTPFVGLPHRLDRGTSGIVLVSRNQRALKRFNQQFQARSVIKTYIALVEGALTEGVHTFQDFMRKVPEVAKAEICGSEVAGAKEGRMRCQTLASVGGYSLLQVELLTGRMHQIRLQLAERGMSVVGDTLYGQREDNSDADNSAVGDSAAAEPTSQDTTSARNDLASTSEQTRFGLHALRLEFRHPQTGQHTVGTAPLPEHWEGLAPELYASAKEVQEKSQLDDGSHLQIEGRSWALQSTAEE